MGWGEGTGAARGKTERVAVPAMPMPLAVLCCILNFLVPGLGTIIAGFSTFCCARNEDMSCGARVGACCVSFGVGILQLLTLALLLFGWIWSCIWGIFFIGMSAEYYHDNPPDTTGVVHPQTSNAPVIVQPGGYYPQYPQGPTPQGPYQQTPYQQPNMQQPGPYGMPVDMYGPQPPAYSGPPANNPYGEPPPPYQAAPSAPPSEKQ